MNILVLAAGSSSERDVSISSGSQVCKALRSRGHNAKMADLFYGLENPNSFFEEEDYQVDQVAEKMLSMTSQVEEKIKEGAPLVGDHILEVARRADLVFMALHGLNGEDGRIQAMFDLYHIPYTGAGHLASAMSMNKSVAKMAVAAYGVRVPVGIHLKKEEYSKMEAPTRASLGLKGKVVVKPTCGGSSVGVSIVEDDQAFIKGIEFAFQYEDTVVIEEFFEGREFSVGVIDGKALPIIEIIPEEGQYYDYENKYNGTTKEVCPANLSKAATLKMQEDAEKAAKALGLDTYCRIDFLLNEKEEDCFLEANTLPGMTATSLLPQEAAVVGMDFASLCEKLVELSFRKAGR